MAYLKVKFPLYFITNLLNMSIGSETKTKEYIMEAKIKGIKVLKPDVNLSTNNYLIMNNSLMLPISSIKNLGVNATCEIIKERQNGNYEDYLDFISRIYGKSVNKKTLVSLILGGILDSFNLTKKTMIENLDMALNYASLISNLDASLVEKPEIITYPEYTLEELREQELESYGFYLSNHPVSKYLSPNIIKNNMVKNYFDKKVTNIILIEKIKVIKTKKGDNMAFLTGSDETGNMEYVAFPLVYNNLPPLEKGNIVEIKGRVTKRYDAYQINIDYLNKLN